MQSVFRCVPAIAGALLCLHAGASVAAQASETNFPTKPIRMIVPFPPGGSNDILARFIAQKMSERLPQQTIVDNRAGADGIIGTEAASRSAPDGHTLLIISISYTMNPAIHAKLPYDPVKSFTPIAQIGSGPNVICSHPSFAAQNVKDLIALAKSKPGELRYATSGVGG